MGRIALLIAAWLFTGAPAAAGVVFKTYGDVASYAIPALAVAAAIAKGDMEGLTAFNIAFDTAVSSTRGIKKTVRRVRPDGSDTESFPSGHATRAFAGAFYLYDRYGPVWGIPALIAATFVGLSRIDAHKHYLSDVIAGVAVAAVTSYFIVKPDGDDVPRI